MSLEDIIRRRMKNTGESYDEALRAITRVRAVGRPLHLGRSHVARIEEREAQRHRWRETTIAIGVMRGLELAARVASDRGAVEVAAAIRALKWPPKAKKS